MINLIEKQVLDVSQLSTVEECQISEIASPKDDGLPSEVVSSSLNKETHRAEQKSVPLTAEMLFSMHGLDVTLPVECDFCPKKFHDMEKFDAHMMTHKECRIFSCQLCHNTYKSWGNLIGHRKACHQGDILSCDACSKRKYHPDLGPVNFPIGDYPNGCEECGEGFTTVAQLYRHFRTHGTHQFMPTKGSLTKVLGCNESSRSYHDSDTNPMSEITYKCNWCAKTFSGKKRFQLHTNSHASFKVYHCHCGQTFLELQDLSAHAQSDHLDAEMTCTICSETVEDFLKHFYNLHVTKENETMELNLQVTCPICRKVFSQPSSLNRHLKLHNPLTRNHECEKCGMVINRHSQILEHARQHYGDKLPEIYKKLEHLIEQERKYRELVAKRSFICEYCGREFNKKLSLQLHVRRHTGDRPYCCQLCGKSFYTNQQLAIHVRQHTGERPYTCRTCSKTFTGPTSLYVHQKLHDKVQRYLCPYCGKRFFWKSTFTGHIRLHTGERPYRCTICNKGFTLKGKLNLHLKKHSSERAILACSDCGENFSSKAKLNAHQDEQCCMTMVTFVEEGPSGEKGTKIIVMNSEDLQQNNIYIDNSEVVNLVVE